MSTTKWYIETKETTNREKIVMFKYVCKYSSREVITYLIEKGYGNKNLYETEEPRDYPANFCLESLDLDKIRWFFSLDIHEKDAFTPSKLNIYLVINTDNLDILRYLYRIGYTFDKEDLKRAVRNDSLCCFKYLIDILKIKIDRDFIIDMLCESTQSTDIKVPDYLLSELKQHNLELKESDINYITVNAINGNIKLIMYLHSKGMHNKEIGSKISTSGNIKLIEWCVSENIPINKQRAIQTVVDARRKVERQQKRLIEFLSTNTRESAVDYLERGVKQYEEDIAIYNKHITYLESLK